MGTLFSKLIDSRSKAYFINEDALDLVKVESPAPSDEQNTDALSNDENVELSNTLKAMMAVVGYRIDRLTELQKHLIMMDEIKDELEKASGEKLPFYDNDKMFTLAKHLREGAPRLAKKILQLEKSKNTAPTAEVVQECYTVLKHSINFQKQLVMEFKSDLLHESLTLKTIAGLTIGITGGLTIVFDAFEQLIRELKLTDQLDLGLFEVAKKIIETIGEPIDTSESKMPQNASFALYKATWARGLKATAEFMDQENYLANKHDVRTKIEHISYKLYLLHASIEALKIMLHACAGLLRVAGQEVKMSQDQTLSSQVISAVTPALN